VAGLAPPEAGRCVWCAAPAPRTLWRECYKGGLAHANPWCNPLPLNVSTRLPRLARRLLY